MVRPINLGHRLVRQLALTGGAGHSQAFPLLKLDRQCCVGGSFSQEFPRLRRYACALIRDRESHPRTNKGNT
jgi:hypothetical protein